MLALAMALIIPLDLACGADYTTRSANVYRRASTTQRSRSRGTVVTNNFYYNQSNQRKYGRPTNYSSNYDYARPVNNNYRANNYDESFGVDPYVSKSYESNTKQTERRETTRVTQERKYFLAHPFFQPLKGNFGSVTDIAYGQSGFGFDLLSAVVYDLDPSSSSYYPTTGTPIAEGAVNLGGKTETKQFLIKQDFSFGITDRFALVAMAQYDSTRIWLKDWDDGSPETKNTNSGLNIFGFGGQWRYIDTEDLIGMASVYYESQRDTSDSILGELKLGYKVDRTTLYLVGRGGYSSLKNKGSSYGVYLDDRTGDWIMLSYKNDVDDLFYAEGGLGLFTVLNKYVTVNAEAFYGDYDWHNQLSARVALGIQPFDSFALNLYASGVLYDSADGQVRRYMNYDVNPDGYTSTDLIYVVGNYKIKNYNEYKLGVQMILHF